MAIDFREVLTEVRAEERRLLAELDTIRASIAGLEIMARRAEPMAIPPMARFAGMGTKEAIQTLLTETDEPLAAGDIVRLLREGGIQSRATDFASTVTSTLNQMKTDNLVRRVEDGWVRVVSGVELLNRSLERLNKTFLPNGSGQPSEQ